MDRRPAQPKFAAAFAAAVGDRAGLANPSALFAAQPDAAGHGAFERLKDAVAHRDYQAALDMLATRGDLADQRPLPRALLDALAEHATAEHHDRHLRDAHRWFSMLGEAPDERWVLLQVNDAERRAEPQVRAWLARQLAGPQPPDAQALRDIVCGLVYGQLAAGAAGLLGNLDAHDLARVLGARRAGRLASEHPGVDLQGLLDGFDWQPVLAQLCRPGLAERNPDTLREHVQARLDAALWRALGHPAAPDPPPSS